MQLSPAINLIALQTDRHTDINSYQYGGLFASKSDYWCISSNLFFMCSKQLMKGRRSLKRLQIEYVKPSHTTAAINNAVYGLIRFRPNDIPFVEQQRNITASEIPYTKTKFLAILNFLYVINFRYVKDKIPIAT